LKQQLDMLQERERLYQQAREQDGALAAQRQDRLAQAEALKAELLNARSGLLALESRLQQARSHKDRMRQEQERARAWQQWAREQDAHASAQQQARQYQDQLDELSRHETELAECSAAVLRLRVEDEALAALRQRSQQVQRLQHQL